MPLQVSFALPEENMGYSFVPRCTKAWPTEKPRRNTQVFIAEATRKPIKCAGVP